MNSVYDDSAIRATLSHLNGDLCNVNVYIFHIQNQNWEGGVVKTGNL